MKFFYISKLFIKIHKNRGPYGSILGPTPSLRTTGVVCFKADVSVDAMNSLLLKVFEQFLGFAVFFIQRFILALCVVELLIDGFTESLSLQPVLLHLSDSLRVLPNGPL